MKFQTLFKITFFVSVCWITSLPLKGGNVLWYLEADNAKYIEMSKVAMLIATDNEATFSVLDREGNILLSDVAIVKFKQLDSDMISGLEGVEYDKNISLLSSVVDHELSLVGAEGQIDIYSLTGSRVMTQQATPSVTIINISSLTSGIYVVKCGNISFKFMKR